MNDDDSEYNVESSSSCDDDDHFPHSDLVSASAARYSPCLSGSLPIEATGVDDRTWKGFRDGFWEWKHREFFEKIARWGQDNGFACALPTFHTETRPDGTHHRVIAVNSNAGHCGFISSKDLRDYGGAVTCARTMCWLSFPSVRKYFHDVSWSASDGGRNIAAAHPTMLAYRGTKDRRIPHPEILFLKRGFVRHSVFRASEIGSPDPNGPPEEIIRQVVERGMALGGDVVAYPDLDFAFDSSIGERVFGVTRFTPAACKVMSVPQSELDASRLDNVASLTAMFKNNFVSATHWTVMDAKTETVVLDQVFSGKETVSASLQASGGYGEVRYKHEGQSVWTHRDFVREGEVVSMP